MKTPFQRILGLNMVLLLMMAVVLRLLNRGRESEIGFLIMMAFGLGAQLLVLLLLALLSKEPEHTRAYWLSLSLVLLIGFGACMVGASLNL